jgi:hypothetical protein
LCECGDDFCHSFHTTPRPDDPYGPDHRTLPLDASWAGMLILDVVAEEIAYVEVIDRPLLD